MDESYHQQCVVKWATRHSQLNKQILLISVSKILWTSLGLHFSPRADFCFTNDVVCSLRWHVLQALFLWFHGIFTY